MTVGGSTSTGLAEAEALLRAAFGARVRTGQPIAPMTSFRIGGPAALFVEPDGDADLLAVAAAVGRTRIAWAVVGKGSNLLVADRGFDGLVVRLGAGFRDWSRDDGRDGILAGASMPLPRAAGAAASLGLSGLEFGVAIPGSVGGAVRMNAGAHGRSMSDVVRTLRCFSMAEAAFRSVRAEEAGFTYRNSGFGRDTLVLQATLGLEPAEPGAIRARMDEARAWRRATQPLAEPNCGSVFKNPPGDHAARLVQAAGGKGLRRGGAEVSTKHANFIVTRPGATAADVLLVIRDVRALVRERFGVELETEVQFLGQVDEVGEVGEEGVAGG